MSRSTTSSSTYTILKYSRAYPKPTDVQSQSSDASGEWQHFTNPVLRVLLEVKKSLTTDELESVKLRVLWTMDSGADAMDVDQREIAFENIDLLSYSTIPTTSLQEQSSGQSLPIKAVFRDSVVGIRYIYPRIVSAGSTPSYRRFQISFASASAASQFVEAICPVCPCKANAPTSAQPSKHSHQLTRNSTNNFQTQIFTRAAPSISTSSLNPPRVSVLAPPMRQLTYTAPSSSSLHLSSDPVDPSPQFSSSETARSSSDNSNSSLHGLASSSPTVALMMPPPPLPREMVRPVECETKESVESVFFESLKKMPTLNDLTQSQLEDLVAQIVREDGFEKLLESLDSMWTVKGFLGR